MVKGIEEKKGILISEPPYEEGGKTVRESAKHSHNKGHAMPSDGDTIQTLLHSTQLHPLNLFVCVPVCMFIYVHVYVSQWSFADFLSHCSPCF